MKADDSRVPDITLERYRLNELPDSMKAHIDALLETDAALRHFIGMPDPAKAKR